MVKLTLDQIKKRFDDFLHKYCAYDVYYANLGSQKLRENFHDWVSGYSICGVTHEDSNFWSKLSQEWRKVCEDFILIRNPESKYQIGEKVTFRVKDWEAVYEVNTKYLFNITRVGCNSEIFSQLRIGNPKEFCSKIYGYITDRGNFPEYREKDFKAIENIIDALQEKCNEINSAWKGKTAVSVEPEKVTINKSPNTTTKKEEKILQDQFKFYSIKKKTYFI